MGNFNAFINTFKGFIRTFVYANFWVAGAVWGLTRFSEELFRFSGTSIAVLNAAATLVIYGFARLFEGPAATEGSSRISQWRERMPKTAFLSMGLGGATILFELIRINEAALTGHSADLGGSGIQIFRTIILPLTLPGIIAGSLLVFIPAVGEFVIPALLGGPDQLMMGKVLWTEFFRNRDWPVASAIAMLLLAILTVPIIYARYQDGRDAVAETPNPKQAEAG